VRAERAAVEREGRGGGGRHAAWADAAGRLFVFGGVGLAPACGPRRASAGTGVVSTIPTCRAPHGPARARQHCCAP
jgi:hypothetical protein